MAIISLRISDELDQQLNREASTALRPKSELIRDAILAYLERQERARFQHQLVRAARARGHEVAQQLASEFLATDNEALSLADRTLGDSRPGDSRPADSAMVRDVRARYRVKQSRHK